MMSKSLDAESVKCILSSALKKLISELEDEWTIDRDSLAYHGNGTRCMMIRKDDSSLGMYLVADIIQGFSFSLDQRDHVIKYSNEAIARLLDRERRNDAEKGVTKNEPHGFLVVEGENCIYIVGWKLLHPFNLKDKNVVKYTK